MEIIADDLRVEKLVAGGLHSDFAAALKEEHRIMLSLRDNVYGGSWEGLLSSLHEGLGNQAYRRISARLHSDIARVGEMQEYEMAHRVNLADYLS